MGHHRGRSFVGFDAFVDSDLGLTPDDAMIHVDAGLARRWGSRRDPLTEETVAAWMRAEAALLPRPPRDGERPPPKLEARIRVHRDARRQ